MYTIVRSMLDDINMKATIHQMYARDSIKKIIVMSYGYGAMLKYVYVCMYVCICICICVMEYLAALQLCFLNAPFNNE